jgi:hypothetical protein
VTTPSWDAVLASFEQTLEGYLALSIAADDPNGDEPAPLPSFTPPAGLGPLPERLRLQATELLSRSRLIEVELARVRDDTATQLVTLNRPRAIYDHDRATGRFDTVG